MVRSPSEAAPLSNHRRRRNRAQRERQFFQPLTEQLEARVLLATDVFPLTQATLTVQVGDVVEAIELTGPATLTRDDVPTDDVGNNGLEDVDLEIESLSLTGNSTTLAGPVTLQLAPSGPPSVGFGEETVNVVANQLEAPILSLLGTFIQLNAPGDVQAVNQIPITLQGQLTSIPPAPGETYQSSIPVSLVDATTGQPTNITVLGLTHTLVPQERFVEVDQLPDTTAIVELVGGGLGDIPTVFVLNGSGEINVTFDGSLEGSALDDAPTDGFEEVAAEFVAMDLLDSTGTVRVRESATRVSSGTITELANAIPGTLEVSPFVPAGAAISTFDLFFDIEVGGQLLHNEQPLSLQATIHEKPPFRRYESIIGSDPIELLDSANNPTGIQLLRAVYGTGKVELDTLPASVGQLLLELPPQPGLLTPTPIIPPVHGIYRFGSEMPLSFAGTGVDLFLADSRLQPLPLPPPVIETDGDDEVATFEASFRGNATLNGGDPQFVELTGPVQIRSFGKANQTTGTFDTEIVSLDLTGTIPGLPPVRIREVPGTTSGGSATITNGLSNGEFGVESFFDVFVELSIDDGNTWVPALDAPSLELFPFGVATTDPQLPTLEGSHRSEGGSETKFSAGPFEAILTDLRLRTTEVTDRQVVGNDEVETYVPLLEATVTLNNGPTSVVRTVELTGTAQQTVFGKVGNTTGTFATEINSLDLTGTFETPNGPFTLALREDSRQASLGQVSITNGNDFRIDSFFDVFTELSINDGAFVPAATPTRLALQPNPVTDLIATTGPTLLAVHYEGPNAGDAKHEVFDGGFQRDEVAAEIVAMNLLGTSSLGVVALHQRPGFPSPGQIEEFLPNDLPGTLQVPPFDTRPGQSAFSTYFVWPQLTIGGRPVNTQEPIFLQSLIGHQPPIAQERYENPDPPRVPLFDAETGVPTGMYILKQIHQTSSTIERDPFPETIGQLLLDVQGTPVLVGAAGPTEIEVLFEGTAEGLAVDDDGDGRDEVVAQVTNLELAGPTPLGQINISLNPNVPSLGQIEELTNNTPGLLDVDPFVPGDADSFFDLSLIVELNGRQMAPLQPTRVESVFLDKPPTSGERLLFAPRRPVQLFDLATGQPTGISLIRQVHDIAPTVEIDESPNTLGQLLLELPQTAGVTTPAAMLPAPGSVYTAGDQTTTYPSPQTLNLEGLQLFPLGDPAPSIAISGADELATFEASLRATAMFGGQTSVVELRGTVETLAVGKANQTTGSWPTEIISMDLRGSLPGGPNLVIRESPTQSSGGQSTITDIGDGNFQIDSFFDIFTEVSFDDGNSWIPQAGSTGITAFDSGVETTSDLPPQVGYYESIGEQLTEFISPLAQVTFESVRLQAGQVQNRQVAGDDELQTFDASLTAIATGSSGVATAVEFTGTIQSVVRGGAVRETGTFASEILSMELRGTLDGLPVIIREASLNASEGTFTVTELPDGTFQVDSFFDVWPELSVDDGQTFVAASRVIEMELKGPRERILVTTTGASTTHVYFEGDAEGHATDDDGNGVDEVVTELVSLSLSGQSPLGTVSYTLNPAIRSLGRIEEQTNNTPGLLDINPFAEGDADSFFDIAFQFDIGGQTLLPQTTTSHVESVILDKPPQSGERYVFQPPAPIPLLDPVTGLPSGYSLVREVHQTSATVEVDIFPTTVGQLLLDVQGTTVAAAAAGQGEIHVLFEGSSEGVADDDDRDGRDEVVAEFVDLQLQGMTPLGPVTVTLDPQMRSLGQIEELSNNIPGLLDVDPFAAGDAHSFFDVYAVVDINGQQLAPAQPIRLESTLLSKPPSSGESFTFAPESPLELFDLATGEPTGIFLLAENLTPAPTIELDQFPEAVSELVLEVPLQPGVNTPSPNLPTNGVYRSPSGAGVVFPGPQEVGIGEVHFRPLLNPAPVVTNTGNDQFEQFTSRWHSEVVFGGETLPLDLTGVVDVVRRGKVGQTTGTFPTELLSLDLQGQIPGGPQVMLRESPSRSSTGETTISDLGGERFQVDSFFDIWTEISIDGGTTWSPAGESLRLDLFPTGVESPNSDLPAIGDFDANPHSLADFVAANVIFESLRITPLEVTSRQAAGPHELQTFTATASAIAVENGLPVPIALSGELQTIAFQKAVTPTGTFETEILSLDLTGTWNDLLIGLRESPTQRSVGTADVIDLGDGRFQIDSFFDVFTELSVDGGDFVPAADSVRLEQHRPLEQLTVIANGTTDIEFYFEGQNEGDAVDNNRNGLDDIVSQIVGLALSASTSAGQVEVTLNPALPSLGGVEELIDNTPGTLDIDPFAPGDADSWFDVGLQIGVDGQALIPRTATTHWQSIILDKPPRSGEEYVYDPAGPVPLLDLASGLPSGFSLISQVFRPTTVAPFQVTALTSTPSGFMVEFNRPIDTSTLNLHDTESGGLGAADVTLVGDTVGPVAGTLVVDPGLNKVTFIRTGGPLPAANYTVQLRSAANGFVDDSGVLLDGDNDGLAGGDFQQSFTVAAPAPNTVVLSLPDFVRGPAQDVNLPADETTGIPVSITEGQGLRSVSFQVDYNEQYLTITGATAGPAMPAGTTVSVDNTTPGVTRLVVTSPVDLPAGPNVLVNLQATVPATNADAIYNSKHILDINTIVATDASANSVPAIGEDAVHIVSYFGDSSGNGRLNASDSARIARVAAFLDGGFASYLLADPLLIGDITGNGRLNASDASRVARVAALLEVPQIPPIPPGVVRAPTGGPDPALRLPQDLIVAAGGSITVPLEVESLVDLQHPHRLAEADAVIVFDPEVLSVSSVTAGGFLNDRPGWNFTANIDNDQGRVIIVALGTDPQAGKFAGTLVDIHFDVSATAAAGSTLLNLVESSDGIHTDLVAENDRSLPLEGPVTNAPDDSVDGSLIITTVGGAGLAAGVVPTPLLMEPDDSTNPSESSPAQVIEELLSTSIDVHAQTKTVDAAAETRSSVQHSVDAVLSDEEVLTDLLIELLES